MRNKWMKKALAAALVSAVCLMPSSAAPSSWAAEEVAAAAQAGLVAETLTQDYQANVTRQQFADLMVRLIETATGGNLPVAAIDTFSDCMDVSVRKAYAVGIADGTSPGLFSPDAPLTREQLAVMLTGALNEVQDRTKRDIPVQTADLSQYEDAGQVSAWAAKDLARMVGSGLIRGTSDTLLSPQAFCTVEQSVLLAYRGYQVAVTGLLPAVAYQKTGQELVAQIQAASGKTVISYVLGDLDNSGTKELAGIVQSKENLWDIWYAASDGGYCRQVSQESLPYAACEIALLPQQGETHVVIHGKTNGRSTVEASVYALREGEMTALVFRQPGELSLTAAGETILSVYARDGYQKPDGSLTTVTKKGAYLYYDGSEYREYGAAEITQEDFLTYTWADEAMNQIRQDQEEAGEPLALTYYQRSNGLLQVQCGVPDSGGGVAYVYYTYQTQDHAISEYLGKTQGQMAPYFSTLPVTY